MSQAGSGKHTNSHSIGQDSLTSITASYKGSWEVISSYVPLRKKIVLLTNSLVTPAMEELKVNVSLTQAI